MNTEPALPAVQPPRLRELEATIERGIRTFVEVGDALAEIRDSKLYRETHGTFAEYVKDRWGWARRTAYDYIEGATVARNVRTSAHLPSVGHAVALHPLSPEEQIELAPLVAGVSVGDARVIVDSYKRDRDRDERELRWVEERLLMAPIGESPPGIFIERAWKESPPLTLQELHEVVLPRYGLPGWHSIGHEDGPGGRSHWAVRADIGATRLLRPSEWHLDGDDDAPPEGWRRWSVCWNVEVGYVRRDFWCDGEYSPEPSPWEEAATGLPSLDRRLRRWHRRQRGRPKAYRGKKAPEPVVEAVT